MGAISPRPLPARSKGPRVLRSALVTLSILLLLLLNALLPVEGETYKGTLPVGVTLNERTKDELVSENGNFRLTIDSDGGLEVYHGEKRVWYNRAKGKHLNGVYHNLRLSSDGTLTVSYDASYGVRYTVVSGLGPSNGLEITNTGSLIIRNDNAVLWTNMCDLRRFRLIPKLVIPKLEWYYGHPQSSLESGHELYGFEICLISPDGGTIFKRDGEELVLLSGYDYRARFPYRGGEKLMLTDTGALIIANYYGTAISVIFRGTGIEGTYTLTATNDFKLSVKKSDGQEAWNNFPKRC